MSTYTFDTSCILNLLKPDESADEALLRLVRLAFENKATIHVTPIADDEVPAAQEGDSLRALLRERLAQFPRLPISPEREAERDQLADELLADRWPKMEAGSRTHRHTQRDCRHVATHLLCAGTGFVTRDEKLIKKLARPWKGESLEVVSPQTALSKIEAALLPKRAESFGLAVREARKDDAAEIKKLLDPLKENYPDFDGWLANSLENPKTRVCLGMFENDIAGIAVWKPKDRRVVKLSTFYVAPDHRQEGLGPHLLFHQIRSWVAERYEKAIVTVSSRSDYLLPFFFRFGFRIEGASTRRYANDATELVLAKHLLYKLVTDAASLADFLKSSAEVFALKQTEAIQLADRWFIPPGDSASTPRLEGDGNTAALILSGRVIPERKFRLGEVEELFYPVRFGLRERRAFLIPIQPQWAGRLLQRITAQLPLLAQSVDKLLLRNDNVYYCSPRYGPNLLVGSWALFYISSPDMRVAGVARVLECLIAPPEELFLRYSDLGIYKLDQIREHTAKRGANQGKAMAIRFGWWVPFQTEVTKATLEKIGIAHPQAVTGIAHEKFEEVLANGGLDW